MVIHKICTVKCVTHHLLFRTMLLLATKAIVLEITRQSNHAELPQLLFESIISQNAL